MRAGVEDFRFHASGFGGGEISAGWHRVPLAEGTRWSPTRLLP